MMSLNVQKCNSFCYSLGTSTPTPIYYHDGQPLAVIASYKDLGVIFDSKLKFNFHYVGLLSRASKMIIQ